MEVTVDFGQVRTKLCSFTHVPHQCLIDIKLLRWCSLRVREHFCKILNVYLCEDLSVEREHFCADIVANRNQNYCAVLLMRDLTSIEVINNVLMRSIWMCHRVHTTALCGHMCSESSEMSVSLPQTSTVLKFTCMCAFVCVLF